MKFRFRSIQAKLLLIPFCFLTFLANAQNFGLVHAGELANMPMPISNNAVVGGWANDTAYVYSFGGIDSTKIWSGITNKSFRYNTVTDVWDTIPNLPNATTHIAAAASYVDSIIYIMGGYQVLSNGNEISSNIVNRYDPRINSYLSNGINIPIPIDDHVQAVYKDSLIYIITGWSNTGNVPNVQIYDPANDNWLVGTPVPNNNTYKTFGASGMIINNNIYYHGGANTGFNFPGQNSMRIGQINPLNPTQITWSFETTNYVSYRAIATSDSWTLKPYIIGGSEVTYNYNGIAYNGSGGVSPKGFSLSYDSFTPTIFGGNLNSVNLINPVAFDTILPMDLRGVAFPYDYCSYIAGGMLRNQKVTNKTFKFCNAHASTINEINKKLAFDLFPNPTNHLVSLQFETLKNRTIQLLDILGKAILQLNSSKKSIQIDVSNNPKGIYFIKVVTDKGSSTQKVIVQ